MRRATSRELAQRFRMAVSRALATPSMETAETGKYWIRRGDTPIAVRYSRPYGEAPNFTWWYGISDADASNLAQGGELALVMPGQSDHRFLLLDGEHTRALLLRCKSDLRGDRKIHVLSESSIFNLQEWPELELTGFVRTFPSEVLVAVGINLLEVDASEVQGGDAPATSSRTKMPTRWLGRQRVFDPNRVPQFHEHSGVLKNPAETLVLREKANIAHHMLMVVLDAYLRATGWSEIAEIPSAFDLWARRPVDFGRVIFECKTLNPAHEASELYRCRLGLAQLLEYRFVHGSEADELCLVTNAPLRSRRVEFLESLGVGHIWFRDAELVLSGARARAILAPRSR